MVVYGDGRQTRDFTSVGSVVAVLPRRGRCVTRPQPVNLAFGSRRSLLDVVAALEAVLGHRVDVVHAEPRPGDVRDSQADSSALQLLFPDVAPVDFLAGLRATVEWFRVSAAKPT